MYKNSKNRKLKNITCSFIPLFEIKLQNTTWHPYIHILVNTLWDCVSLRCTLSIFFRVNTHGKQRKKEAGEWVSPRRREAWLPVLRRWEVWLPALRRREAWLPALGRREAWLPEPRRDKSVLVLVCAFQFCFSNLVLPVYAV